MSCLTLCLFFLFVSMLLSLFFPGQSLICTHLSSDTWYEISGRCSLDLKGTFLNLKTWYEKTEQVKQGPTGHSHWTGPRRHERHILHKGTTGTAIPPAGTGTSVTILQGRPIPTTLPRSAETRHNHQAHTCQLWQETEWFPGITQDFAYFCNNFTSLTLTHDHHPTILSFFPCHPSAAVLRCPISPCLNLHFSTSQSVPKMSSHWFPALELKMLLSSDPNL